VGHADQLEGEMDGGLDGVIKKHLGAQIEKKVQAELKARYGASMPIGTATACRDRRTARRSTSSRRRRWSAAATTSAPR
jgi:O-acetyl-ADP-ribose deacetylase (regulator of RNase III)